MPRPKQANLQKITMNIREGDFEKLATLFPTMGASVAARKIISAFVDRFHQENVTPVTDLSIEGLTSNE